MSEKSDDQTDSLPLAPRGAAGPPPNFPNSGDELDVRRPVYPWRQYTVKILISPVL